jgi:hypothetical protein
MDFFNCLDFYHACQGLLCCIRTTVLYQDFCCIRDYFTSGDLMCNFHGDFCVCPSGDAVNFPSGTSLL